MPLKIAAKVGAKDRDYFEREIRPLLALPGIEYIGEIGDDDKSEFLSGALALLMPIDWPEPFGLVMIEAMACGTPVIAFRSGSVPEVVEHGVTGLIVDDEAAAVDAINSRLAQMPRMPVTPWSSTSGTEPQFHAITGVPQAIASIITSPKGSGH